MEGVKTGEVRRHDLELGFSQKRVHTRRHRCRCHPD